MADGNGPDFFENVADSTGFYGNYNNIYKNIKNNNNKKNKAQLSIKNLKKNFRKLDIYI